jgi:predicted MarR family transcription regulator
MADKPENNDSPDNNDEQEWLDKADILVSSVERASLGFGQIFKRWLARCAHYAGESRLSYVEWLTMAPLYFSSDAKKSSEIAYVLSIEDIHIINYAHRRLIKFGYIEKHKQGKEVYFSLTESGRQLNDRYFEARRKFLLTLVDPKELKAADFENTANHLNTMLSLYEHASRLTLRGSL